MIKPKIFTVYLSGEFEKDLCFFAFDEKEALDMAYEWIKDNKYNGDVDGVEEHNVDLFEEEI